MHFHYFPLIFINLIQSFIFYRKPSMKSQRDVQDQIRQQFLPRSDKYKDIVNNKLMPVTNQSCVVIPCLTKTYGFKTNQYKANYKYLHDMISEQMFSSFIRKANNIIEKELINKSTQQDEPFFKFTSLLLKISIILSAVALILMAIITYANIASATSDAILYVSVVLLACSSFVAAFCPIYLSKAKYAALNYQHIISEKLKELEASENKQNESEGLRHIIWKFQNNFYWIQLHINRLMAPRIASTETLQ